MYCILATHPELVRVIVVIIEDRRIALLHFNSSFFKRNNCVNHYFHITLGLRVANTSNVSHQNDFFRLL